MKDEKALLNGYAEDQLAAIKHVLGAVEEHLKIESIDRLPEVQNAFSAVRLTLGLLREELEQYLSSSVPGYRVEGTMKSALSNISGFLTGLYGQLRSETLSRAVRDDLTALNFLCTTYSMLFAAATSFEEGPLALVASRGMHRLTPLIVELSLIIPLVVVHELTGQGYQVDPIAIEECSIQLNDAWNALGNAS